MNALSHEARDCAAIGRWPVTVRRATHRENTHRLGVVGVLVPFVKHTRRHQSIAVAVGRE